MLPLTKNPLINRHFVQNYVGISNFQKGENYAINKAIRRGKLKNYVLTALCQGHEFDPYRVEVIFNQEGIQHSYCSCPVGAGGKCKHVAALLLTWLESPDTFTIWDDLKSRLQTYDSHTLLELIDLLEEHSEKSDEVIQAFQNNLQIAQSPELARFFRRIEEAFHVTELPWYHSDEGGLTEITFALGKIRSDALQLLAQGKFDDVLRITQTSIQHILNYLDDHADSWGNLTEELKGNVNVLDQLFAQTHTPELRQKIVQVLFRLVEEQLYREGNIAADEAKQVILDHTNGEEKQKIVGWIQALQTNRVESPDTPHSLEDFLIDLQKEQLDPEIYLAHYRQTGQVLKLIDSLLDLDRLTEAKKVAKQKEFFSQTLPIAQLFVKHRQEDVAEKLVLTFLKQRPDLQAYRWLKDFYQKQNKPVQALEQAKHILYLSPQFAYYQDVREQAQALNQWPVIKQEVITYFKDLKNDLLLIEIYLDEKELEQAIDTLKQASETRFEAFKNTYYSLLALQVAAAARHKYPQVALEIYQDIIKELIEERNRESYQKACDHLKTIRSIYLDQQRTQGWEEYLKNLMQTYRRLKALRDEIYRADLV